LPACVRRPAKACLAALLAALALCVAAAGCGGNGSSSSHDVVVALDFTPNAVHAPLYMAAHDGFDREHGIRIRIRTPASQPDALKLLASGRIDVGILDIHDLGLARERGRDIVGIAALVQRPLAALITQPGIHRPRDLAGHLVGVSGLPSDPAFLRAIVEHDGGDYARVRQATIGFQAVSALLTGKVDAVPAFWNAEGVDLRYRGKRINEFRVDDYGAPPYPEVVFMTTRRELAEHRARIERFLAAVKQGVVATLAHPAVAAGLIARAANASNVALIRAQLRAVAPALRPPLRLDRAVLERWATFDARIGILRQRPDVGRTFDFTLVH
jgi:NitT/TauT family transport system substrate-binding protein/putative hydroxymethylpyrimidine transport system substrate-binding protein